MYWKPKEAKAVSDEDKEDVISEGIRIRLTADLPISDQHKCFKGKEYDVTHIKDRHVRGSLYFFKAETGQECAAYFQEFEVIS